MSPSGPTVLVLYSALVSPLKTAVADHLRSFGRYGSGRTIYLNISVRSIPPWIERLGIDVVVFHTTLLSNRWDPPAFRMVKRKLRRLRGGTWTKVAIPQDEFLETETLCAFLREFNVDQVLTCASPDQWPVIYGDLVDGPTTFTRVLTGYLDADTVARIDRLAQEDQQRAIDISYRAKRAEPWLGRHALLKSAIAGAFEREATDQGLTSDISVRPQDTLIGDAWYRLLLGSRWTIGVEGGASVIDRDGTIRKRTLRYLYAHPQASFEEVEAACFPGQDGSLHLMALSPRHLEACATRTAQALIEGEYNGVLEAGTHYLPVRADLTNLADVCRAMQDDDLRASLADRAYRDVVASGRFDYHELVRLVVPEAARRPGDRPGIGASLLLAWESRQDRLSWFWVAIRQAVSRRVRQALVATGLLPYVRRIRDAYVAMRG